MAQEELKLAVKEAIRELMVEHRPLTYKIYKGKGGKQGCFQFTVQQAYRANSRKEEGAVFVEAAAATAPDVYDWDNKIIFALGPNDIGTMLSGFQSGKFELYHDPDANTQSRGTRGKRLTLEAGRDVGTFFLKLTEKAGDANKTVNISLTPGEARILVTLLASALPKILAWAM